MAHLHVQPFALTRDAVGVAGLLEEGAIARAEGGVRADERLEVLLPLGSREERPLAPAVLEVGANARRLIKPEVALVVQLDARHFGGWHVRGCSSSFSVAVPVLIAWSLAATAIVTVMAATAGVVAAAVVGVAAVVAAGAVGAAAAVGVAAATVGVATAVVAAAAMGATVGVPSVIIATLVVALRIPAVATVSLVITLTLALGHVIQGHRKASWLLALLRHIFLAAPTFVLLLGSTTAPRARSDGAAHATSFFHTWHARSSSSSQLDHLGSTPYNRSNSHAKAVGTQCEAHGYALRCASALPALATA